MPASGVGALPKEVLVINTQIRIASSDEELEKVSAVLLQLRTAFSKESLLARIKAQQGGGYQVAYLERGEKVVCVAGFVVGIKLAWGKHLYVDDLVTDAGHRSTGAGAEMLGWLKDYALKSGCGQVHLDSGVQRFPAHRFYLSEGFNIASHHFSITEL